MRLRAVTVMPSSLVTSADLASSAAARCGPAQSWAWTLALHARPRTTLMARLILVRFMIPLSVRFLAIGNRRMPRTFDAMSQNRASRSLQCGRLADTCTLVQWADPGDSADTAGMKRAVRRRSEFMDVPVVIVLAALAFLMFVAYRGYSVILFAPIAALGAVLLTDPAPGCTDVHRPVHGEDGRLPQALFPGVPARRGVRQADRDVRLLEVDRRRHDPRGRRAARDALDRAGLRAC